MKTKKEVVLPSTFVFEDFWYPKVLYSAIHLMVNFYRNISKDRIINRYCHLHLLVSNNRLSEVIENINLQKY